MFWIETDAWRSAMLIGSPRAAAWPQHRLVTPCWPSRCAFSAGQAVSQLTPDSLQNISFRSAGKRVISRHLMIDAHSPPSARTAWERRERSRDLNVRHCSVDVETMSFLMSNATLKSVLKTKIVLRIRHRFEVVFSYRTSKIRRF